MGLSASAVHAHFRFHPVLKKKTSPSLALHLIILLSTSHSSLDHGMTTASLVSETGATRDPSPTLAAYPATR
ncbi:hypothetical protein QJS10_CPA03g01362 [Acorus calamus]|uniref:Uncharacterized protein n=1 Tax=Acorus calamus TaxID=4465 RepID=A0AAV9FAC9_ACOCL|nr:hypothetical protein QJS10_CPA03g01362 [Acorus calamus]